MLHTRLRLLAALAAALVLLLSACTATPEPAAPPGVPADVLIRAAMGQTTSAGSSRFALTSTTTIGGTDVTFAGEGSYDYARRTGQMVFQVPGPQAEAAGGTIEQRMLGDELYLMLPQQPEVFYKLLVSDVAGTTLGSSTDPTAALQALTGVSEVNRIGTEQIRGQETTHYEGRYDVAQALAGTEGLPKVVLQSTLGRTTLEQVPFEAFLDAEGRVVKFEQRIEMPASPLTGDQPLISTSAIELFDFGTEVTVTAPPGEAIRDGAPLLAALQELTPQQPVPPAPAPPPPGEPAPAPPVPVPAG